MSDFMFNPEKLSFTPVFRDFCTKKERETMKIIKRNGSEATFDSEKIVAAITKANNSEEGTRLSPDRFTISQTMSNINATRSGALYP